MKKLKTIDLFAGIGCIRKGFEKTGRFETVYANDFEPSCKLTYDLNFGGTKLHIEDINKVDINKLPSYDFLLGGFPCQAFSIAGYRKGFKDEKGRGNLFFKVAEIIEKTQPMGFFLENVKNLESHDSGNTFRIILETLKNLGYYFDTRVLNSMNYGNIPQNRERIYIVGFRSKKHLDNFRFPEPIKLDVNFRDLLEDEVNQKYYYENKPLFEKIKDYAFTYDTVYQWRRQYVRANKKGVCPTLTANMGTGGHNVPLIRDFRGIRKLTPLECARMQGFKDIKLPVNLTDSKLYKQMGNSVTVSVIERIAQNIINAIDGKNLPLLNLNLNFQNVIPNNS